MGTISGIILLVLSIVITNKICRILFRNTIGTMTAYITRTFIVWLIVMLILGGIFSSLGIF